MTLEDALVYRDDGPKNPTAMLPVNAYLEEVLGEPREVVATSRIGATGALYNRMRQGPARAASVLAVILADSSLLGEMQRGTPKVLAEVPGRRALIVMIVPHGSREVTSWTVFEPVHGDIASRLEHGVAAPVTRVVIEPNETEASGVYEETTLASEHGLLLELDPIPEPPGENQISIALLPSDELRLVIDERIRRMLRLAIASSKAVMLIGPPGTGKTTLLAEAFEEARLNPAAYGLTEAPRDWPLQVTPEEGWTTRELVGGETIDDEGHLRFKTGHVLDSIQQGRWLVLDEANRADMDRIFGGLLTFLSGKPVTLGKGSGGVGAAPIVLEWGEDPDSAVVNGKGLETGVGDPIRFRAGADWRLLGTYNALDAHRVFRFGQALGRRFARVPVPAIDVDAFRVALAPRLDEMEAQHPDADRQRVETVLVGLYAEHQHTEPVVGPALFLAVPSYVSSGLALPGEGTPEPELEQLLVEGYLLGAGPLLAQLADDDLDTFHKHVVTEQGLIAEDQWQFLTSLLPTLS